MTKSQAYFGKDIKKNITNLIEGANESIYIAVAWLTEKSIIDALTKKKKEKGKKIVIKVLVDSDKKNFKKKDKNKKIIDTNLISILESKIKLYVRFHIVYTINSIKKKHRYFPRQMHNKFCVIDEKIVITGSANWTNSIFYNKENIIVLRKKSVATQYKEHFDSLIEIKKNDIKLPAKADLCNLQKTLEYEWRVKIKTKKKYDKILEFHKKELKRINNILSKKKKAKG